MRVSELGKILTRMSETRLERNEKADLRMTSIVLPSGATFDGFKRPSLGADETNIALRQDDG